MKTQWRVCFECFMKHCGTCRYCHNVKLLDMRLCQKFVLC